MPASRRELRRISTGASCSTASGGAASGGGIGGSAASSGRGARTGSASAAPLTAADAEIEAVRARPHPGPVAGREREPDAVPGRERVRDRRQRDAHLDGLAGDERARLGVAGVVRQVEDAERDERR